MTDCCLGKRCRKTAEFSLQLQFVDSLSSSHFQALSFEPIQEKLSFKDLFATFLIDSRTCLAVELRFMSLASAMARVRATLPTNSNGMSIALRNVLRSSLFVGKSLVRKLYLYPFSLPVSIGRPIHSRHSTPPLLASVDME